MKTVFLFLLCATCLFSFSQAPLNPKQIGGAPGGGNYIISLPNGRATWAKDSTLYKENKIIPSDSNKVWIGDKRWKQVASINDSGATAGDIVSFVSKDKYAVVPAQNSIRFYEYRFTATDNESAFTNHNIYNNHIRVWREGWLLDSANVQGYTISDSTVNFNPSLKAGERVYVEASTVSAWNGVTIPINIPINIIFIADVGGLNNISGIWTGTTGSGYGNTGIDQINTISANGWVQTTRTATDAHDAFIGLSDDITRTSYAYQSFSAVMTPDGTLYYNSPGAFASTGYALAIGETLRINRTGTQVKLQTSTDEITWIDRYTYAASSSGVLYPVCDISHDPSLLGKIYYPKVKNQ